MPNHRGRSHPSLGERWLEAACAVYQLLGLTFGRVLAKRRRPPPKQTCDTQLHCSCTFGVQNARAYKVHAPDHLNILQTHRVHTQTQTCCCPLAGQSQSASLSHGSLPLSTAVLLDPVDASKATPEGADWPSGAKALAGVDVPVAIIGVLFLIYSHISAYLDYAGRVCLSFVFAV